MLILLFSRKQIGPCKFIDFIALEYQEYLTEHSEGSERCYSNNS